MIVSNQTCRTLIFMIIDRSSGIRHDNTSAYNTVTNHWSMLAMEWASGWTTTPSYVWLQIEHQVSHGHCLGFGAKTTNFVMIERMLRACAITTQVLGNGGNFRKNEYE